MYHSGSEESDLVSLSKHAFCLSKSIVSHFPEPELSCTSPSPSLDPLNKEEWLRLQENGGY